MFTTLLLFALGFVILIIGAELLVRGSAQLAAGFGIPPLIIGLTIVAYGTSAPELFVSVTSALEGQTDIALGNVIGSNIINILLILGASAAITPLIVDQQLVRLDVPIMIAVSFLLGYAASTGVIDFWMGALFLGLLVLYTIMLAYSAKNNGDQEFKDEYRIDGKLSRKRIAIDLLWVAIGIGLLTLGSRWLVDGAVLLANLFGVSELVISLTIVAVGTSLPELATSIVAAIQGKRDIAVGNIVGSNIFNILAVLGASALVAPIPVPEQALAFDIPVMVVVAIACLPIFFLDHCISRWEGFLFLIYYIAYNAYLLLQTTGSPWFSPFRDSILYFVIPLTAITLGISVSRHLKRSD